MPGLCFIIVKKQILRAPRVLFKKVGRKDKIHANGIISFLLMYYLKNI